MSGEILPSAKTIAAKTKILQIFEEDPSAKVIIFTEFIGFIKIMSKVCKSEQWGHCIYHGGISQDARSKAIVEFREDKEKRILLASQKAGGLGLNLTMASRVICVDPWWNKAVEQQAFGRVFRIGQTRETTLTHLVVRNSIDESMVQISASKQKEIDQVITESKRGSPLDVMELLRLFGPVQEDEEGHPFLFAEEASEHAGQDPEHLRLPNNDRDDEDQAMGNEA